MHYFCRGLNFFDLRGVVLHAPNFPLHHRSLLSAYGTDVLSLRLSGNADDHANEHYSSTRTTVSFCFRRCDQMGRDGRNDHECGCLLGAHYDAEVGYSDDHSDWRKW